MTCGRESHIFCLEIDSPGVRCKVIKEDDRIPILPVRLNWIHPQIRMDQFKQFGCPCFGSGEGLLCHLSLCTTGAKVFRGDFDIRKILDIFPSLLQHFTRGVHEVLVHNLEIHIIHSGETAVHFCS